LSIFSSRSFGAPSAFHESVERLQFCIEARQARGFPKEVIMTITICNSPAVAATVGFESAEPAKLTELVRGNVQRLLELVGPLVRRQSVALDLASIQRIDAAGISALVALYTSACDAGHGFTVSNASPRVTEILEIVGLDRILVSHNAVRNSYSGPQLQCRAA
jgi:anti-anti-sigma factor